MRTVELKYLKMAMMAALVFGLATFTGCKDDEEEDPTGGTTLVEDGIYLVGDGTAFSSPSLNGAFSITRNEVRNGDYNDGSIEENDRPTLLEAFAALSAGGEIIIRQVSGDTTTDWGWGADMETVAGGSEGDGPQVDFMRGSFVAGGTAVTVPNDGLYHIAFDTEVGIMVVIPLETWGLIGQATPGGWSSDTPMNPSAFSTSGMTYSISDVAMTLGEFKFRSNGGWKVILDEDYDNGPTNDAGIKINTNYGDMVSNLVPGGDNINNTESGIYDIEMSWTPSGGWSATATKTADLPPPDWSDVTLGIVGDGLSGGTWDVTLGHGTPTDMGNFVYEYDFGVHSVVSPGGFKIRENMTEWTGTILGWNDVTITGSGAGDFEATGGYGDDFGPTSNGTTYSFKLIIDSANETMDFNIVVQ